MSCRAGGRNTGAAGNVVNLRLARKRRARAEQEAEAAANRAKHGASKEERARAEQERASIVKTLDQARREDRPGRDD